MGMGSPEQDNGIYANAGPIRMLQRQLRITLRLLMTELLHAVSSGEYFASGGFASRLKLNSNRPTTSSSFPLRTTLVFPDVSKPYG